MKTYQLFTVFFLLLFLVLSVQSVSADGGLVWHVDYDEHVYLPEQKAVLFWDGTNETMVLSSKLRTDNITDIAWMIPLFSSQAPNVSAGDTELFTEFAYAFADAEYVGGNLYRSLPFCFLAIGIFFVAMILLLIALIKRKTSSFRLFISIAVILFFSSLFIGFYASFSMNLSSVGPDQSTVNVIEMKQVDIYDVAVLQSSNASDLLSWLHNHQYYVSSLTESVVQEYCNQSNAYFVVNRINLTGQYSNETEMNQLITNLQQGITTPLSITFQPEQVFYPMKLTSINEGITKINVYVVTDYFVNDTFNLLTVKDTAQQYFDEAHGTYITWLTFEGNTNLLTKDSVFQQQDPLN